MILNISCPNRLPPLKSCRNRDRPLIFTVLDFIKSLWPLDFTLIAFAAYDSQQPPSAPLSPAVNESDTVLDLNDPTQELFSAKAVALIAPKIIH